MASLKNVKNRLRRLPCFNDARGYQSLNFMEPLLEDEGETLRQRPITFQEHNIMDVKAQWFLFGILEVYFIVTYLLDPSITIVLAHFAFIPSLVMYKWFRRIWRRAGEPSFPDTVRTYTWSFWYAHFISFAAVVFWILLTFEVTLSSTWKQTRTDVEYDVGCEEMVLYDISCAELQVSQCEFVGQLNPVEELPLSRECTWSTDFGGCVILDPATHVHYPCTLESVDRSSFYSEEEYQEQVDLEIFRRLRTSFPFHVFFLCLTLGKGFIEQSVKYHFSTKARKRFPTMLTESHIDGMLYLITIIGIAFGTAEAIFDVAIDLLANKTIIFLLVSLFFGTLNHGVTSYIIGIGLCKRYILRQKEQGYCKIIMVPILIQWGFDYLKWWLLDYSMDNEMMQVFFTIMCMSAFSAGYCILSRFRKQLRDEFLAAGFLVPAGEGMGIQLEVTSYNDDVEEPDATPAEVDEPPAISLKDEMEGTKTTDRPGESETENNENIDGSDSGSSSSVAAEEQNPLKT